jgi:uncharacterized protein (DUF2147 family)
MRKLALSFCFMFFALSGLFAQAGGIVGFWLTQDGDSQVEIYRVPGNKFNGRIVWLNEPLNDRGMPKVDDKNPDRTLRDRPTLGLELLKDFSYNPSKQEWEKGTIYDPKSGRTYDCFMWLDGDNTLKLKGFVLGMRFLGREATWTRDKEIRN